MEECRTWMALTFLQICPRAGRSLKYNPETSRVAGQSFQDRCEAIVSLHDAGLTRLREIKKIDGKYTELTFEHYFTAAGDAVLNGPAPQLTLSADTRRSLEAYLTRQSVAGDCDSPLINSSGQTVGVLSDFLTQDQIKANAKDQLDLLNRRE